MKLDVFEGCHHEGSYIIRAESIVDYTLHVVSKTSYTLHSMGVGRNQDT